MLLLIHLLSSIAVDYYRSIHPLTFLGSPFHQKVVVQIRSGTGTMTLSPGLTILIFFAAVSIILQACTWSSSFASVRCCQILSSHLHSAHITPCLTHSAQVLWYHLMWSMRSSAYLNFLLHSEQLFASSVPNSTRWLFFCASSSYKVWHSSCRKGRWYWAWRCWHRRCCLPCLMCRDISRI